MSLPHRDSYKFIVRWFDRNEKQLGDLLVGTIDVAGLSAATVKSIFQLEQVEHAIGGCHLVTGDEKDRIERLLGQKLDLENYDYFVEAVQK